MVKRAVLIGINDYEDPGVSDLAGCVNDVELMTGVLTEHYGFDAGNVSKLVKAPDNSRAGIFEALDGLIDATQTGDVALVYYSGHGSQAPDTNSDEDDEYDETLVPSDSGRGSLPVRDIIDDELHSYLEALAQKTDQASFIFDSCHSGSVDRNILVAPDRKVTPRAIPAAEEAPQDPPHLRPEAADSGGEKSASGLIPTGEYVLIAGCQDPQTSKETDFEGRRNGALTYFFAKALQGGGDVTLQAAFDEAVEGVHGSVEAQDPVLEGPRARLDARPF